MRCCFRCRLWAQWKGHAQNYGAMLKADLVAWEIAAGAFNSRFTRADYASLYFDGVGQDGVGRSFVVSGRDQRAASTSGEIRVSRTFAEGPRRHRVLVSARGRSVETDFGGYALEPLGGIWSEARYQDVKVEPRDGA